MLDTFQPLEGIREYLVENWFVPNTLRDMKDPQIGEAWSGSKYNDYGGYGYYLRPKTVMEIGTAAGYSLAAIIKGAGGSVLTVSMVDFHPDIHETQKKLAHEFPDVVFIKNLKDSCREPDHIQLPASTIDLLHIDGDHSYWGCSQDLKNFGPLTTGLIVVDDARDDNVRKACDEFAAKYKMKTRFIPNFNGHYLMMRDSS